MKNVVLTAAFAVSAAALLGTGTTAVPQAMRGTFAHGSCANVHDRMVISASTVTMGGEKPQRVVYFTNDRGKGEGAIHWSQEGDASNIVAATHGNVVLNTEGYGMPGQVLYKRCSATKS